MFSFARKALLRLAAARVLLSSEIVGTAQKDIPEVQGEGPTMRFNQIVHSAPASTISCARRDAGCQFP
jgi:hypothetical protein